MIQGTSKWKPCPFCQGDAEVREHSIVVGDGQIVSGKSIGCWSEDCYMQPKTYPCNQNALDIFSHNWNVRKQGK